MKFSKQIIALFLVGCGIAWADDEPNHFKPTITAEQMRPHVEFLASPDLAGRSGEAKDRARKYIIDQWKSAGLKPLFTTEPDNDAAFEQAIPGSTDEDGKTPILGYNIGAWVSGSDPKLAEEIVIVSAHYDHLGTKDGQIYAGADDNASGVAMLIESSRQTAADKTPPRRSMVFISFDLEERMLWGSRWFAAHPPWPIERVKLFVTADMIGRSLGDLPMPAVFIMGSERAPELRSTLEKVGTPKGLEVCRLGTDIVGTRSDYGAFRDREIPFLFFSTGQHPDYHSPRDTPERVEYDKAARIASLILKVSRSVADSDQPPKWNSPDNKSLEEPRVLQRITTLILEADKQKPMTQTQRFLVTNVHNRTRQMIDANKYTAEDRAWLVRMSQLLMLSLF